MQPDKAALAERIETANLVTLHHWNGKDAWDNETELTIEEMDSLIAALRSADGMRGVENMARLSASEVACYRWPQDTAEHRAMRAAFMDGAAHIAHGEAKRFNARPERN